MAVSPILHHPGRARVSYLQDCVVGWGMHQQIVGRQVPAHYSVEVEVARCGQEI